MTSNAAPLVAVQAAAGGGFARDFGTADGGRFMVTARTGQQFSDLARTARLASTFAFLERLLQADFSDPGDLYTHRDTIATLLAAWFAQRTVTELAVAFSRTSVPWAHLDDVAGR